MSRSLFFSLLALCILSSAFANESPLWNGLSSDQQQQLLSGKVVEINTDVAGSVWPRFTIYRLVKSPPATVAAVFWDCQLDPSYIPNCSSVRILSHPCASSIIARYTIKMPFFLPDEVYEARNKLRQRSPTGYEITWKVQESRYTKGCCGSLIIENHEGHALLCYSNLVIPGSRFAGLLRSSAGSQVLDSVNALVEQIRLEVAKNPGLLEQQLKALEHSLGH